MNTLLGTHGLALAMAAGLSFAAWGQGSPDWPVSATDDFAQGAAAWRFTDAQAWEGRDGVLQAVAPPDGRNTFATLRGTRLRPEVAVEVGVTIQERTVKDGWSFAGVAIYQDASSFWMLALTEGPDGRRYSDFLESYVGTWQAQNEGDTALAKAADRVDSPWVPGRTYRLRLVLQRGRVEAEVLDADGQRLAAGAYAVPSGVPAVRAGLPALLARGCRVSFDDVAVKAPSRSDAPPAQIALEDGPKGRVGLLLDDLPGSDRAAAVLLQERLRRQGFGVTALRVSEVCDDRILTPANIGLYVVPACRTYPAAGGEALLQYARQGGHIVFVGGPLLDLPLWQAGREWLTAAEVDERCRLVTPEFRPFVIAAGLDLSGWQRATGNPAGPGDWAVAAEGPDGGPCLRYSTGDYQNWDGRLSPPMTLFGPGHDLFVFSVQADRQTPQIAVEVQEEDGSRWIATVETGTEWRRVALRPAAFHYWHDSRSKGRGGAQDSMNPAQARRVSFGLAHTHTPGVQGPEHVFRVADLGTARNPLPGVVTGNAVLPGSLEGISPRYKTHPLAGASRLEAAVDWSGLPSAVPAVPADAVCAIPRTQGMGFDRGQRWRYVPLLKALGEHGDERGAPAWLLLNRDLPYPGCVLAGFGLNDLSILGRDPAWGDWIAAVVERILTGGLLSEAGTQHFAYWPGEAVVCGLRVCSTGTARRKMVVSVAIRRRGETAAVWQQQAALEVAPGTEATWQETWTPPAQPGVYDVEVSLASADGRGAADRVRHEVAVLDPRPAPPADFVRVQDGRFVLRGEPWYPVGVNYWPLYVSGMDAADYWAGWLDQRFYDPDLVERDLQRLEALGINMVSIQSHDLRFHRNLLDFLRRCGPHGIKVNLYCGLASPLGYQGEALRTYIETTHLRGNATVFAYDTVWEPGNYVFGRDRARWDSRWRDWIDERYGSLEAAEADWGIQLPRDNQGQAGSPPDMWFREDGNWRTAMAAYRRFMDNLTSGLWNRAHRGLRAIDPNHLVSFRQGNTLPHDFVFTGTPKHVDFMCPEGYSIPNSDDGYNAAGFISRYVAFTTGGKPILWSEFGMSVWDPARMAPNPATIPVQGQYHERFYRMVLESGAHGTAPWWWPGGYRVGERSDFGIVNPDGSSRPAAELIRTYGPSLKSARAPLVPDTWLEFDRDAHAGGYWYAAFHHGLAAYRDAVAGGHVLGIRTPGTGTTSADTPLLAVGNRPLSDSNPPKYLDAEFNWLQVRDAGGRWVEAEDGVTIAVKPGSAVAARISIGNTQEAAWVAASPAGTAPGTVCLAATRHSELQGRWPIATGVPYLGDADLGEIVLTPGVTATTQVDLQMTAVGRAWFGERRTFRLQPAP